MDKVFFKLLKNNYENLIYDYRKMQALDCTKIVFPRLLPQCNFNASELQREVDSLEKK